MVSAAVRTGNLMGQGSMMMIGGWEEAPAAAGSEPAAETPKCPTCGSEDRKTRAMVGCGFVCDDPSGWHSNREAPPPP